MARKKPAQPPVAVAPPAPRPGRLAERALERVRQLCLALPEATERPSHGAPAFFIRDKKTFVTFMDNHHGDGRLALWCAAPLGLQGDLVHSQPERFFIPPYVGPRGWVGVRLDQGEHWETVAQLIREAWRTVAPKTLLARLPPGAARSRAP